MKNRLAERWKNGTTKERLISSGPNLKASCGPPYSSSIYMSCRTATPKGCRAAGTDLSPLSIGSRPRPLQEM
eukprot:6662675-Prorocentrum_lima.AAC.1